jgi:hypothetical protein
LKCEVERMKKEVKLIVGAVVVLLLFVSITGCTSNNNESNTLSSVIKSLPIIGNETEYGNLSCSGRLIEDNGVMEAIEFSWKADVVFPGDVCMGDIYVPLFNVGSWEGYFPVPNPNNWGSAAWDYAKGEHHIWEYKITLYENDTHIEVWGDEVKTWETWLNDIAPEDYQGIGWPDFEEGEMEVYGAFRSMENISDISFKVDIETEPFTVVREGNDFYFLE